LLAAAEFKNVRRNPTEIKMLLGRRCAAAEEKSFAKMNDL